MVVHHWSDDGMVMYHRRSLVASVFVLALYLFSTCICRACLPDQLTSITPIPSRALSPCKTDRGWKQCEEIICKSHAHTIHINIYVKLRHMWRSQFHKIIKWHSLKKTTPLKVGLCENPNLFYRWFDRGSWRCGFLWCTLCLSVKLVTKMGETSWQVILSRASLPEKKKENKNFLGGKLI